MQRNMGGLDRSIRLLVGLGAILTGIYYKSLWGLLGVPVLLGAALALCPLYNLFGINTMRRSAPIRKPPNGRE